MSKRTPLNMEMNSIIRATAVLIFLKYFIVNRREKRFWYLCLFSKALETFFYASHKQSFSWLEAEDTATTCCHHTDPSMHLNSLQQRAYLSCITRENEKEEGEIGRAKKNVTAYQQENSSYSDYILCQGWKSTTKKALFVNPVVFMLLFPSISIYVCLSLLLLFSKFQPAKHALHRQRDTLDMLFIASYSYVIFFVGQETIGVRSQTFHLHQKHSAFCPCWMSLVRHRWSDGWMWEAGFRAAGAQRLSGWWSVQRWDRTDGIKSFVWIALT